MSYVNWISSEFIISDYIRRSGHSANVDEEYIYSVTEDALDHLVTADNLTEYVVLKNLYNQKTELPNNFVYPTQVGYRYDYNDECVSSPNLRSHLNSCVNNKYSVVSTDSINKKCVLCHKTKCNCNEDWTPVQTLNIDEFNHYDQDNYKNFMHGIIDPEKDYKIHQLTWLADHLKTNKTLGKKRLANLNRCFSRITKCPDFQIVRPATNYFFNLPNELKLCNIPNYDTNLEYKIDNKIMTLNNFEYKCHECEKCKKNEPCYLNYPVERNGQVLISYLGRKIDNRGFLMIPDLPYMIKAITEYIIAQVAFLDYSIRKDQISRTYWNDMKSISDVSMIHAKAKFKRSSPDKFNWFLERIWSQRFPDDLNGEMLNRYNSGIQRKISHQAYNNAYSDASAVNTMFDQWYNQ
jgi:hypothetical protein